MTRRLRIGGEEIRLKAQKLAAKKLVRKDRKPLRRREPESVVDPDRNLLFADLELGAVFYLTPKDRFRYRLAFIKLNQFCAIVDVPVGGRTNLNTLKQTFNSGFPVYPEIAGYLDTRVGEEEPDENADEAEERMLNYVTQADASAHAAVVDRVLARRARLLANRPPPRRRTRSG